MHPYSLISHLTTPTSLLPRLHRRHFLMAAGLAGLAAGPPANALPVKAMQFPRDFGAHPDFRTEWWYITGHAGVGGINSVSAETRKFGFQLTFFRSRIEAAQGMKSKFSARQLLFAHAAITDVKGEKLLHDQRIARDGFGVAFASEETTNIKLRDWSLMANQSGGYTAELPAADFGLSLQFSPTQPVLLQGNQGLSRKGPQTQQASYYYSQPQLATTGRLRVAGQTFEVAGKAWLDHEWSQELLHPTAVGWDWIGMNLNDGSALTAFRLRDKNQNAVWDGGSFRSTQGGLNTFSQGQVTFQPVRSWKSPSSQTSYPIEWLVRTPAETYTVKAIVDNQELDSRQSTGSIYWEGLSALIDSKGKTVGSGYLEMTGYTKPLQL